MTAPLEVKRVDRGLIERAQDGDRDAYEQLAQASARRLYAIAYRIVRDRDRADDAVQQALIAIWRDIRGLRDPDRFDAWTYRLVVRACLAETRRPRRLRVTLQPLAEDVAAAHDETAHVADRDELERAFRSLSPDHRAVLVLRHYGGLSVGEIAAIMDVPPGTVGSRIHHATSAMRASIEAGRRLPALRGQEA